MKRLLLFVVAIVCALYASAQEVDSLKSESLESQIDSLSLSIKKLQHDYDYISCDYDIHKVIMDLKDLSLSINDSSTRLAIYIYNSRYDSDLYQSYRDEYESYNANYDSLKKLKDVVKISVLAKLASSDFSMQELNVISASLDVIEKASISVEKSLHFYDIAIQTYRKKR